MSHLEQVVTNICKMCGQVFHAGKEHDYCSQCEVPGLSVRTNIIPHKAQRYDTAGDYIDKGQAVREIFVSFMGNRDYEFLVLLHELIEQHLCLKRGISEESISDFDMSYKGEDPGSSEKAPYHKEHMFALKIEDLVGTELGIDPVAYEKALSELQYD